VESHEPVDLAELLADLETPLRRALVVRFGVDVGTDTCRDAIAWGWEHADQVAAADNPAGLLYRVAQSKSRRYLRWRRPLDLPAEHVLPDHAHEPQLPAALARLSDAQRVAVVLVHGYRYSYAEVADVLGVPVSTVRNHVHRGLDRLRNHLEH